MAKEIKRKKGKPMSVKAVKKCKKMKLHGGGGGAERDGEMKINFMRSRRRNALFGFSQGHVMITPQHENT